MNTFVNFMDNYEKSREEMKRTENGALAYNTTSDKTLDLFALGGAYRNRDEADCISLFKRSFLENPDLSMKCLFYLRDVRGGQGERRFFRVVMRDLAQSSIGSSLWNAAEANLEKIPEFGRWDDLFYITHKTSLWDKTMLMVTAELIQDMKAEYPSLLAKWLPSENASSHKTKAMAKEIRQSLGLSARTYRKTLSHLRNKINLVESKMSANDWGSIEFDKIPSRAGINYREAFHRHEAERYADFMLSKKNKVNAGVLYPYDIFTKMFNSSNPNDTQRATFQKYWDNLPDYFNGSENSIMCVCDTSGSMTWSEYNKVKPITVATSLAIYAAEHNKGELHNKYISFSSNPQFISITGNDIYDKYERIIKHMLIDSTNLKGVFDLLKYSVLYGKVKAEDLPKTLVIISDMEIDEATWHSNSEGITEEETISLMDSIAAQWEKDNLVLPNLVYWNVNARNDTILGRSPRVSFVSGCSPVIFEQVVSGKTGVDIMMDKLMSERYSAIHA